MPAAGFVYSKDKENERRICMNINGKTAGGFLLIVFGLFVFFGGGHFAFIIPLAIGGLMLYWGIKRFSKGRAYRVSSRASSEL